MKKLLIILLILISIFSIACKKNTTENRTTDNATLEAGAHLYIKANNVLIRETPNTGAKILGKLNKHSKVVFLKRSDTKVKIGNWKNYWYKIKTKTGITGWTYGEFITYSIYAEGQPTNQIMNISELNNALFKAVQKPNNKKKIISILKQGADPNAELNQSGLAIDIKTILTVAIRLEAVEYAKILLEHSADPNKPYKTSGGNYKPLWMAVDRNLTGIIELLIKKGANVNYTDQIFNTPVLHHAIEKGFTKIAKILIINGADVNANDNRFNTPLMLAKRDGHSEIVKMLKASGARE